MRQDILSLFCPSWLIVANRSGAGSSDKTEPDGWLVAASVCVTLSHANPRANTQAENARVAIFGRKLDCFKGLVMAKLSLPGPT